MPKDIDYRIGQEVQSARLVVPIFSLVAVSPFLSARQRIKRSMHAWDGIMLRCTLDSRFTDLELLQLGLIVQWLCSAMAAVEMLMADSPERAQRLTHGDMRFAMRDLGVKLQIIIASHWISPLVLADGWRVCNTMSVYKKS